MLSAKKTRGEIVQSLSTEYKVSARCVDNWIKEARIVLQERQQQAEEIRVRETDVAITDAVQQGLLSDIEIEAVLCRIVVGGMKIEQLLEEGVIVRDVTPFEMINAARTIYQKRGSNAPTKVAATNGKGEDVKPISITLNLG